MAGTEQAVQLNPFWAWVCARRAHDNPRGDFIRDTRELVRMGINPGERIVGACAEALEEYDKLHARFSRLAIRGA